MQKVELTYNIQNYIQYLVFRAFSTTKRAQLNKVYRTQKKKSKGALSCMYAALSYMSLYVCGQYDKTSTAEQTMQKKRQKKSKEALTCNQSKACKKKGKKNRRESQPQSHPFLLWISAKCLKIKGEKWVGRKMEGTEGMGGRDRRGFANIRSWIDWHVAPGIVVSIGLVLAVALVQY